MIKFNPRWREAVKENERAEIVAIYNTMAAVYKKVEHRDVPVSFIATMADMAWAVWEERKK
jgi:hypothetical protein